MYTAKPVFQLQHSCYDRAVQLVMLLSIAVLLYALLNVWGWLMSLICAVITYIVFSKQKQLVSMQPLDGNEWSLLFRQQAASERAVLSQIFDCQVFMVVCFHAEDTETVLIWRDQLPLKQWKRLKTLAKLL